jgi:hypothetical protein
VYEDTLLTRLNAEILGEDWCIEAWWLCALRDNYQSYQNCQQLEDESGNDASPNSLKSQIEKCLGEPATRLLLNDKIDSGEIDIDRIDMDSMNKFKQRLNDVLDDLLPSYEKGSIVDRDIKP